MDEDRKLILVVEDDLGIQETLKEILETENYQVVTANNGKEALFRLINLPLPDLILLDMTMPVMSGREFLDEIKIKPNFAHIPVIILSALAETENSAGAVAFLRKPADLEVLLSSLKRFML